MGPHFTEPIPAVSVTLRRALGAPAAWRTIVLGHQDTLGGTRVASLANGLTSAGDTLSGIPLVGGGVSAPFDQMSSASQALAEAGRAQVTAVHRLSWALGISLAVIPILCVAVFFLPIRWRFVREATASARFIDAAEDLDLFALRALARQPMYVLAKISDDPAGAWRARDPEVVTALARLELRDAGLAVPAHLS